MRLHRCGLEREQSASGGNPISRSPNGPRLRSLLGSVEPAATATVIITGASSGFGFNAAQALARRGWFVVMAGRELVKAAEAAKSLGMAADRYPLRVADLGSHRSVRAFVGDSRRLRWPLQALGNHAAVDLLRLEAPQRSPEGYEISVATNHLGHFLLSLLLLDNLRHGAKARLVTLREVTAIAEASGGKVPIPARPTSATCRA